MSSTQPIQDGSPRNAFGLHEEEEGHYRERTEHLEVEDLVHDGALAQVEAPRAGVRELQNPTEAEPEEEEVESRDQGCRELVARRAREDGVEELGCAPLELQPVLDAFRQRLGIAVEVARVDEQEREQGQEEVGRQQHRVELPVSGLVAPDPADRGALARGRILVLDPEPSPLVGVRPPRLSRRVGPAGPRRRRGRRTLLLCRVALAHCASRTGCPDPRANQLGRTEGVRRLRLQWSTR